MSCLWSLMVAAVPTCARQLSFNFSSMVWGGAWPGALPPPWIRPCVGDVIVVQGDPTKVVPTDVFASNF